MLVHSSKLIELARQDGVFNGQTWNPGNDRKSVTVFRTEQAILTLDTIATAHGRDESRCCSGGRWYLIDHNEGGFIELIGIVPPFFGASRRVTKESQCFRQFTRIAELIHSRARFGRSIFIARLDHDEVAACDAQQLRQYFLLTPMVRLHRVDCYDHVDRS